jgi:hypothetical protein
MPAMKMQKPGLDTGLEAPSEGAVCAFKRPSRHVVDHLVDNAETAPAWVRREPYGVRGR